MEAIKNQIAYHAQQIEMRKETIANLDPNHSRYQQRLERMEAGILRHEAEIEKLIPQQDSTDSNYIIAVV